jgi:hypothetical protein
VDRVGSRLDGYRRWPEEITMGRKARSGGVCGGR